jgi:hypothetical protein
MHQTIVHRFKRAFLQSNICSPMSCAVIHSRGTIDRMIERASVRRREKTAEHCGRLLCDENRGGRGPRDRVKGANKSLKRLFAESVTPQLAQTRDNVAHTNRTFTTLRKRPQSDA